MRSMIDSGLEKRETWGTHPAPTRMTNKFSCKKPPVKRSIMLTECHNREASYMRRGYPLHLTLIVSLLMSLCVASLAQEAPNVTLTNADVQKMLKAGLPESIILREIQLSRTNFATTPNALIELKKHGASEAVLGAVLDRSGSGGAPVGEAMQGSGIGFQAAGPHSPHLPSFKADLKVNGKHEKFSMEHNQIKLQGKGVPSFDLKWKTGPSSQ